MKQNLFFFILSVVVVVTGMLIAFAETVILVNHGMTIEAAFVTSLYTGFIAWIFISAAIICSEKAFEFFNKITK